MRVYRIYLFAVQLKKASIKQLLSGDNFWLVLREVLKLVYSTYVYNFTASMHRQTNEYLHWYSKWENSNICDIYLCNMHLTFGW